MKLVYLLLAIIGAVLPLSQLLPFLREHGLDLRLLVEQLFANRISSFFGLDVIVSAFVLFAFMFAERRTVRHVWAPIAATLLVGVSCGLPLYLFLREAQRGQSQPNTPAVRSA